MKQICLAYISFVFALQTTGQKTTSISRFMQYCQSNLRFNGVVLVAEKDKIIYEHAFGKANEELNINNTLDTKFRLGSISKQFTAFIVLKLVESGRLSLNEPLAKYITAFNQPGKQNISIHNLLTHTSGLADYTNFTDFNDQLYYTDDSIIKMIADAPISYPPSSTYNYSNSNFYLLALVIEKIIGKDFIEVLKEMILQKTGMLNSGEEDGTIIKKTAKAYIFRNDSTLAAPSIEMRNTKGGGGMFSTAEDLLKWSRFFQQELGINSILKNTLQPFLLNNGAQTIYSCGWCLLPGLIFHTGHINGFANLIAIDTIHQQTIILLSNEDYRQLIVSMLTLKGILQNDVSATNWIKNKPVADLADYRGTYSIGKLKVDIREMGNLLEGDSPGQKQYLIWYRKDEFFFLNWDGVVKFERNEQGDVVALKSFQDYRWVTLMKE